MSDQRSTRISCLTGIFKKRILLIPAIFILAVGLAFIADRIAYQHFVAEPADMRPVFTDGSEAYEVIDCVISDGAVIVTGYDPRFSLHTENTAFSRIHIIFREPVGQDTALQVFYAPVDGFFSEPDSLRRTIAAGTKETTITVPETIYSNIRFDFEQNVVIEKISVGNKEDDALPYQCNFVRMVIIFAIVFIPLCVLILIKTYRKSDSENKNERK